MTDPMRPRTEPQAHRLHDIGRTQRHARTGPQAHHLHAVGRTFWDLPAPVLYEEALRRNEGVVAGGGALVVSTGHFTGRSPKDKFIVQEPTSDEHVWWGPVNRPLGVDHFGRLRERLSGHFQGRDVFAQNLYAGADPNYQLPIRVITEGAWHNLFARIMFINPPRETLARHAPQFTVLYAPGCEADPAVDGTRTGTFIVLNFAARMILIGGTSYGGEIKKSIFTALNYLLPREGVLSMHCSANVGQAGDVALFFGLSGTGKTSLSTDPSRPLIGDDEHGWSDDGVFNFEGGCYAKTINLSPEAEPQIYAAVHKFGTVLENVVFDPETRELDLADSSLTENTRAAYPITHLTNIVPSGRAGHPRNIVFLTADAFGVMPPIARLSVPQALYHFLSGYTSKLAGTERGLGTEPETTFSTCFGAPFLVLRPTEYSRMLGERIARHGPTCWLVNTGWTGGPFGVGHRMSIAHTRALITAALTGQLDDVPYEVDRTFGLDIPTSGPGIPSEVLRPRDTWADPRAYDEQARALASHFQENFRQFEGTVPRELVEAGPQVE